MGSITVPFTPPSHLNIKPLTPLSSEHEGKRLEVLEHFSDPNYKIPGQEAKGELDEQERFWLVGCQPVISWLYNPDCRAMSASSVVSVVIAFAS